jgi:heptose I phosphotransferase
VKPTADDPPKRVGPNRRAWTWIHPEYAASLPHRVLSGLHELAPDDRQHAKQGRSTGRLRIDTPSGPIGVYLKRHERWPLLDLLRARMLGRTAVSPAGVEWRNLGVARALGVAVPDAVAAAERIDAEGRPHGVLIVREVNGEELHLALPRLAAGMDGGSFDRFKRRLAPALAGLVARLHLARRFHKDLYLCHLFLLADEARPISDRLVLIDLQRLARHGWDAWRWRWKDLGQLLFSTFGVEGLDDRDRLRFWKHYRRHVGLRLERLERAAIRAKAASYLAHNRGA